MPRIFDNIDQSLLPALRETIELRSQALGAFQNVFGADAAEVYAEPDGSNHARNARIHIATYQTLGVDTEGGSATFLTTHYPENYFSQIVIDECHR